ncbi:hypothetical protein T484DRAFT_3646013, partial [Baffinella frigidus]
LRFWGLRSWHPQGLGAPPPRSQQVDGGRDGVGGAQQGQREEGSAQGLVRLLFPRRRGEQRGRRHRSPALMRRGGGEAPGASGGRLGCTAGEIVSGADVSFLTRAAGGVVGMGWWCAQAHRRGRVPLEGRVEVGEREGEEGTALRDRVVRLLFPRRPGDRRGRPLRSPARMLRGGGEASGPGGGVAALPRARPSLAARQRLGAGGANENHWCHREESCFVRPQWCEGWSECCGVERWRRVEGEDVG